MRIAILSEIIREWRNLPAKKLPKWLRRLYKGWMLIAIILGTMISHVLLVIIFYLVVTPWSLFLRLIGKDILSLRREADSYWVKIDEVKRRDYYEKYF